MLLLILLLASIGLIKPGDSIIHVYVQVGVYWPHVSVENPRRGTCRGLGSKPPKSQQQHINPPD